MTSLIFRKLLFGLAQVVLVPVVLALLERYVAKVTSRNSGKTSLNSTFKISELSNL